MADKVNDGNRWQVRSENSTDLAHLKPPRLNEFVKDSMKSSRAY